MDESVSNQDALASAMMHTVIIYTLILLDANHMEGESSSRSRRGGKRGMFSCRLAREPATISSQLAVDFEHS